MLRKVGISLLLLGLGLAHGCGQSDSAGERAQKKRPEPLARVAANTPVSPDSAVEPPGDTIDRSFSASDGATTELPAPGGADSATPAEPELGFGPPRPANSPPAAAPPWHTEPSAIAEPSTFKPPERTASAFPLPPVGVAAEPAPVAEPILPAPADTAKPLRPHPPEPPTPEPPTPDQETAFPSLGDPPADASEPEEVAPLEPGIPTNPLRTGARSWQPLRDRVRRRPPRTPRMAKARVSPKRAAPRDRAAAPRRTESPVEPFEPTTPAAPIFNNADTQPPNGADVVAPSTRPAPMIPPVEPGGDVSPRSAFLEPAESEPQPDAAAVPATAPLAPNPVEESASDTDSTAGPAITRFPLEGKPDRAAEVETLGQPITAPQGESQPIAAADGKSNHLNQPTPGGATVRLFYGTDRAVAGTMESTWLLPGPYVPAACAAGLAMLLMLAGVAFPAQRFALGATGGISIVIAAALATGALLSGPAIHVANGDRVQFGNQRGQLTYGVCEVTIPPTHRPGQLESPSLLKLEVRTDPRKHIAVRQVISQDQATFLKGLRAQVAQSPRKDVFVFVHGYNTTFENAGRRAAQIAHDLHFQGAPVFFSWPSQGGLLKYTVDETNVAWSVPHLKQLLLLIGRHSGAEQVSVVAHSMGNRALTGALRELKYELQNETALFDHVVLAAPDIDAEIFRRDIAPALTATAQHVTLYASSDDRALRASKKVHGYPRAGDSGADLVVVPGIETIDVSGIDTSLLGHSYYANSRPILADLRALIQQTQAAGQRAALLPIDRHDGTYWRLQPVLAGPSPSRTRR